MTVAKQPRPADRDSGAGFMESAVPLLREYADKLQKLVDDYESACADCEVSIKPHSAGLLPRNLPLFRHRRDALLAAQRRMEPSVRDLMRRVSQMIDHGTLDAEIDRVELKLRLAELEFALQRLQSASQINISA